MSPSSRVVQAVLAGAGVILVQLWPSLAAWWAAGSGSAGDMSEAPILAVGLIWALVLGVLAGWAMARTLDRVAGDHEVGRLDPWAAYALGLGTYGLAITALTAITLVLLLTDENQSLRSREWMLVAGWASAHLLAAVAAYKVAFKVLPDHEPAVGARPRSKGITRSQR